MPIQVLKPGLLTTIQDTGRIGLQKFGITVNGAMDSFAMRTANMLLNNDEHAPVLEITLKGPVLTFDEGGWIAVCGADLLAHVEGEPLPLWRPVYISPGRTLTFRTANIGCRAYLAVKGGFAIRHVLGSSSTNVRSRFGGIKGRRLAAGDVLHPREKVAPPPINDLAEPFYTVLWHVSTNVFPQYNLYPIIRVMPGSEHDTFTADSQALFLNYAYKISTRADRMGMLLEGPTLERDDSKELVSEPVTKGTIQVLPDGRPLVLMADRQTTGGYPRIAQVAKVDLPVLAQLKPGNTVEFEMISHETAEQLHVAMEWEMQQLKQGTAMKWKEEIGNED